jgi:hypothetical protein
MDLKKEFSNNDSAKLIKIFQKWQQNNVVIQHGWNYNNVEATFGLPYTSSGAYAGLWNTNTQAVYAADNLLSFDGIGYAEDMTPVAFFTRLDDNGNEIEDVIKSMVEF